LTRRRLLRRHRRRRRPYSQQENPHHFLLEQQQSAPMRRSFALTLHLQNQSYQHRQQSRCLLLEWWSQLLCRRRPLTLRFLAWSLLFLLFQQHWCCPLSQYPLSLLRL
jgi:hypothetical protein